MQLLTNCRIFWYGLTCTYWWYSAEKGWCNLTQFSACCQQRKTPISRVGVSTVETRRIKIVALVKHICTDLINHKELSKCLHGKIQNQNESFNSLIFFFFIKNLHTHTKKIITKNQWDDEYKH